MIVQSCIARFHLCLHALHDVCQLSLGNPWRYLVLECSDLVSMIYQCVTVIYELVNVRVVDFQTPNLFAMVQKRSSVRLKLGGDQAAKLPSSPLTKLKACSEQVVTFVSSFSIWVIACEFCCWRERIVLNSLRFDPRRNLVAIRSLTWRVCQTCPQ